ncbi:MAG: indole-3-glycerol phosphate synthase TrpC [Victivallaceae bacterium]|nr:indole-3-glycerol phosphate synthase TrpC [Victivallaceae bacterium]
MTILDEIINRNREELDRQRKTVSLERQMAAAEATAPCRDFKAALARTEKVNVIAELKKASPSKGIIRLDFDVIKLSRILADNGAVALSVLTEQFYFKGSIKYLKQVKANVGIPILRKDFIFDPYQVYEAKAVGADAILLIAAALDADLFNELHWLARQLGLHVLSEIHNQTELDMVMECEADIIGINCRDLKTFKTDLKITEQLLKAIPNNKVKVAESGIKTSQDIQNLKGQGANAFLIGETVMSADNPGVALQQLIE